MTKEYSVNGDMPDVTDDVDVNDVTIEVPEIHEDIDFEDNCFSRVIARVQGAISACYTNNKKRVWIGVKIALLLAYLAYFAYCMYYR